MATRRTQAPGLSYRETLRHRAYRRTNASWATSSAAARSPSIAARCARWPGTPSRNSQANPDSASTSTLLVNPTSCAITLPSPGGRAKSTGRNLGPELLRAVGTSMAAPHISGIVAQVCQASPWLTPAQVEDGLEDSACKFAFDPADSSGRVLRLRPLQPPTTPPRSTRGTGSWTPSRPCGWRRASGRKSDKNRLGLASTRGLEAQRMEPLESSGSGGSILSAEAPRPSSPAVRVTFLPDRARERPLGAGRGHGDQVVDGGDPDGQRCPARPPAGHPLRDPGTGLRGPPPMTGASTAAPRQYHGSRLNGRVRPLEQGRTATKWVLADAAWAPLPS